MSLLEGDYCTIKSRWNVRHRRNNSQTDNWILSLSQHFPHQNLAFDQSLSSLRITVYCVAHIVYRYFWCLFILTACCTVLLLRSTSFLFCAHSGPTSCMAFWNSQQGTVDNTGRIQQSKRTQPTHALKCLWSFRLSHGKNNCNNLTVILSSPLQSQNETNNINQQTHRWYCEQTPLFFTDEQKVKRTTCREGLFSLINTLKPVLRDHCNENHLSWRITKSCQKVPYFSAIELSPWDHLSWETIFMAGGGGGGLSRHDCYCTVTLK